MQVTLLYQIGFQHIFNGVAFFTDCRRNIVQPDGAAAVSPEDCERAFVARAEAVTT